VGLKQKENLVGGFREKNGNPEKPYGMELIPQGSYIIRVRVRKIKLILNAPTKTVLPYAPFIWTI